jgi:hypothetical protein
MDNRWVKFDNVKDLLLHIPGALPEGWEDCVDTGEVTIVELLMPERVEVVHGLVIKALQFAIDLRQNPSRLATWEYSDGIVETSWAHVATAPSKISGCQEVVLG